MRDWQVGDPVGDGNDIGVPDTRYMGYLRDDEEDIVDDFFFYDVTIVNPTETASSVDDVQFLPVFITKHVTPEEDHKLIEIADDGTLLEHVEAVIFHGLNGYFIVPPTLPAHDYAVIVIEDDISTSISDINRLGKATKVMINQQVYILQGKNVYSVTGKKQ